ncbi:MAG: hypothetical protein JSW50_05930 [Candidatus Latescibacterota bacterium]|nr:MAG: hypothetical protein JSW50_05930 [Candidatus Latescibacterota bacterium]
MKRIVVAAVFLAFSILSFNSCILDPKETPPDEKTKPTPFRSLAADQPRDNVLFNLQKAYVERNIDRYDELLDAGFVFHFSQADFKDGKVSVEQWDRASEVGSATNIFNRSFSKPGVDPVSEIDLTLRYTEGDDSWTQVTPEDQQAYPNETWYEKTVRYNLIVTSGPIDYTGLDIEASFIVRKADVEGQEMWRIISWRDDTQN